MSDISERLVVHCPDHAAGRHLAAFLAKHTVGDGAVKLALRLPVGAFGDRRARIERRIVARLSPLTAIGDAHPTYSVTWTPVAGGGLLPDFAGALAVETSTEVNCFGLVVTGHYDPPLGIVGALFDVALGRRIAHASARDLLRTIADFIENVSARNTAVRRRLARTKGH